MSFPLIVVVDPIDPNDPIAAIHPLSPLEDIILPSGEKNVSTQWDHRSTSWIKHCTKFEEAYAHTGVRRRSRGMSRWTSH
jgi:hypothetical protein